MGGRLPQMSDLELPSIGWQLFILDSSQRDPIALPAFLDTYATRLLTEPLSDTGPCPSRCSACPPRGRTSSGKSQNRDLASAHRGRRSSWPAREVRPGRVVSRQAYRQCQL